MLHFYYQLLRPVFKNEKRKKEEGAEKKKEKINSNQHLTFDYELRKFAKHHLLNSY